MSQFLKTTLCTFSSMLFQEILALRILKKVRINLILVEEDKIFINNQSYQKNRLDLIASQVLSSCNISNHKNKNNNTALKHGEGKLMITNGMSVKDFIKKYSLN